LGLGQDKQGLFLTSVLSFAGLVFLRFLERPISFRVSWQEMLTEAKGWFIPFTWGFSDCVRIEPDLYIFRWSRSLFLTLACRSEYTIS